MKFDREISNFLDSKKISDNTRSNYFYDLRQFDHFFEQKQISAESLQVFKKSLSNLAYSAQRRKITSANQFLDFLYQKGKINQFYRIEQVANSSSNLTEVAQIQDFSELYRPLSSVGQFIALLILEFGLTFSEIQSLKWSDFDWNFRVLTIEKRGMKRILPIKNRFANMVSKLTNADEVFVKSRQFLYLELKKVSNLTATELREQYILQQVKSGQTIYEVAASLGLATITTLEKYYK